MADDRYDRVTFRGAKMDKYSRQALQKVEKELGYELTIRQGAYNKGVGASAGTHDGGGAFDFVAPFDEVNKVKALRKHGFAAWIRPAIRNVWSRHIHAVQLGNEKASPAAKSQMVDYKNVRSGLANNAKDPFPYHPYVIYKYETGTTPPPKPSVEPPKPTEKTIVKALWYNIPGPDKLKNDTQRAKDGAALVKTYKPNVIGFQELVGRVGSGKASPFANKMNIALGSAYTMIVPTTNWNENYTFFEKATTKHVKQYPDKIIRVAGAEGKHLSVNVFEDIPTGKKYVHGNTHLSNGSTMGVQRGKQAEIIMAELTRISKLHSNCAIFVGGDMNRSDDLAAFTKNGLVNMRKKAKLSNAGDYGTFTTYSRKTMPKNPDNIIDHGYVSKAGVVDNYTVLLGYQGTSFPPLRPSDHVPIGFTATL